MVVLNASARLLLSAILCCSTVFASPTSKSSQNVIQLGRYSGTPAGAAYFLTNEPSGNYVVVAALKPDGTMTYTTAISNKGNGAHGNSTGPDPLFAQSTVKTSAASNVLAAVNAGSNTVSLFSINPKNPTDIQQIGQPVPTLGDFPISVAFNSKGTQACVLNAGGLTNGVNCFKIDKSLGLVPIKDTFRALNLSLANPPTGPANTLTQVLFNKDDSNLIVTVKGNAGPPVAPGFLAIWDVNADGSLSKNFTQVAPPVGGVLPFGTSVIPSSNALLVADPAIGAEIVDLSELSGGTSLSSSSKSSILNITKQGANCWTAYSSKTGNFYLADPPNARISEVSVDKNLKATVVRQYQRPPLSGTFDEDVVTLNGKDFLYILQANATEVGVMRLDGAGKARDIGNFNVAKPAQAAGLTINSVNLVGMTTFATRK
ncbi:hypothetical protein BDY19DRAFT_904738 [Irpex rosettiformis]|uniref:Uncharacterized protein n=1 Tax=Irpex rosettiformis TaxID=378272 RepID=A0ACB8UAB1_9APHY|nr:hypothetical protein BDY19DRAFT_904738 [Irpex rosettiformis]